MTATNDRDCHVMLPPGGKTSRSCTLLIGRLPADCLRRGWLTWYAAYDGARLMCAKATVQTAVSRALPLLVWLSADCVRFTTTDVQRRVSSNDDGW